MMSQTSLARVKTAYICLPTSTAPNDHGVLTVHAWNQTTAHITQVRLQHFDLHLDMRLDECYTTLGMFPQFTAELS